MKVTAHGVAVFSGVILGAFGVLGRLPPIVLFPGAALAAALGGLPSKPLPS